MGGSSFFDSKKGRGLGIGEAWREGFFDSRVGADSL